MAPELVSLLVASTSHAGLQKISFISHSFQFPFYVLSHFWWVTVFYIQLSVVIYSEYYHSIGYVVIENLVMICRMPLSLNGGDC